MLCSALQAVSLQVLYDRVCMCCGEAATMLASRTLKPVDTPTIYISCRLYKMPLLFRHSNPVNDWHPKKVGLPPDLPPNPLRLYHRCQHHKIRYIAGKPENPLK